LDTILLEELEVRGARSTPATALDQAVRLLESGRYAFDEVASHAYSLDQAEEGLLALAGERGERPIHARIEP
jgi:threonine dehydrogenase-like Zn-dependent dehydrogenase